MYAIGADVTHDCFHSFTMTAPNYATLPRALTRLRLWSPLASDEVPLVTDLILDKEDQLEDIESRIQVLEEELQMLKSRRDNICEDLLAHRALIAPIRNLPLDVLSEIFSFIRTGIDIRYMEEEHISSTRTESSFDEDAPNMVGITTIKAPPILLSHVCSAWNCLVNQSGFLWSKLSLELDISYDGVCSASCLQRAENALASVIGRSNNTPLYVTLNWFQAHDKTEPEVISILSLFFGHSHRWKTANLAVDRASKRQLCRPMPILEALSFSLWRIADNPKVEHFFCQAPSLQTVTLRSSYALSRSKLLEASRLHTLIVEVEEGRSSGLPSVSQAKDFLSQCRSLRSLSWNAALRNTTGGDERPIVLPITVLKGSLYIDHLLPHILLPSIETFDLEVSTPTQSAGSVLSVIQEEYRSFLTTLRVCDPGFLTSNGRPWLLLERSIRRMFIQLGSFPQLHTLILVQSGEQGSECSFTDIPQRFPKLKTLSYTVWSDELDWPAIFSDVVSLVKAFRSASAAASLEKVELRFPGHDLSEEQRSVLRDVQQNGLCLEVRDADGEIMTMLADASYNAN